MSRIDIVLDTNVLFSALYSQLGSSFTLLSEIGRGKLKNPAPSGGESSMPKEKILEIRPLTPRQVTGIARAVAFNVHVSVPLLFEYEDVLKRNQKELGLSLEEIDTVIEFLCSVSTPHFLYFSWRPCLNDPDDEMLLELAIAANARYIVTYNTRHFKGIHGFNVRAIKPSDFLKLLEE